MTLRLDYTSTPEQVIDTLRTKTAIDLEQWDRMYPKSFHTFLQELKDRDFILEWNEYYGEFIMVSLKIRIIIWIVGVGFLCLVRKVYKKKKIKNRKNKQRLSRRKYKEVWKFFAISETRYKEETEDAARKRAFHQEMPNVDISGVDFLPLIFPKSLDHHKSSVYPFSRLDVEVPYLWMIEDSRRLPRIIHDTNSIEHLRMFPEESEHGQAILHYILAGRFGAEAKKAEPLGAQ